MLVDSPIEIGSEQANYSVIWLHGLGADGHDFAPVVELLNLPNHRFVLPHAPHRPITLNNGYEMRAWYDLYSLTSDSQEDDSGIRQTQTDIESLIQQEKNRGISSEHIFLAGFSQGGAIALHTALRYQEPLAGVIALSTYLPLKDQLATEKTTANQNIPIFMAHGTEDEIISLTTNQQTLARLESAEYQVQWHTYPIGHSVSMEEIGEIRDFLIHLSQ